MNNPFDYIPSPEMLLQRERMVAAIKTMAAGNALFAHDINQKMFGILLVEDVDGSQKALWAFSGQIGGRLTWDGFVPPVFDYLDPEGYFCREMNEIKLITQRYLRILDSPELKSLKDEKMQMEKVFQQELANFNTSYAEAKQRRDELRKQPDFNEAELIRESQFLKAERKRIKKRHDAELQNLCQRIECFKDSIEKLREESCQRSNALQAWLFRQFVFVNGQGERRNLNAIFGEDVIPPSGSGECCEPRLLNHAFLNGYKPLEMAMFWWGDSPIGEVRRHMSFYPACRGKCKPILQWMLSLSEDDTCPDYYVPENLSPKIIYEDDALVVVDKPAGMLSVPGKSQKPSVQTILAEQYGDVLMVHRLDQDTSGLLVVAKDRESHKHLQRQFAEHTIHKEYIAILEAMPEDRPLRGRISLPLSPDYLDRPRQRVDKEHGAEAVTLYEFPDSSQTMVRLTPLTGRTHQLRVHCSHPEGLGVPIKGDRLYGIRDKRMYLHAALLEFSHPKTGERMLFESKKY